MISYLKGKIVASRTGFIILETGGVGYGVHIDSSAAYGNGDLAELFIHQHIREDLNDLFGFKSFDELNLFEKLISVNGVGPKAGIAIMSAGKPERIIRAISGDEISFFTAISGIGKKVAAKIILDLKSKLSGDKTINILSNTEDADDLFDALEGLGYKRAEVTALIVKIPPEIIGVEERLRWCLKNLSSK